jgi:uncharacterized DUF497 family protein
MEFEWDEEKRRRALDERGLGFADVVHFDLRNANVFEDERKEYGERRFIAFGYLFGRLCCLVFAQRESRMRVVSLRKANEREKRKYG